MPLRRPPDTPAERQEPTVGHRQPPTADQMSGGDERPIAQHLPASDDQPVDAGPSVPRNRQDAGVWLVCAGLGFVVGQLASAILLELVALVNGHASQVSQLASRTVPPAWVVVTELVGLWLGFVGGVLTASRLRGSGSIRRDMGLSIQPRDVPIGAAVGLAGQLLLLPVLYIPLQHAVSNLNKRLQQPAQHLTGGFPGSDIVVIAVLTIVVVPVVEELFFRGLVLGAFRRLFRGAGPVLGTALAAVTTGVIFGLAHFELLELLGLAVFGVILSYMAIRFGRLGPSIFAHATFNLVAILSVAGVTGSIGIPHLTG
jgi:uncharacterized protein